MRKPTKLTVRWTRTALANLASSLQWLDEHGAGRSELLKGLLADALDPIGQFPATGRVPLDVDPAVVAKKGVREVLVDDFRLGYSAGAKAIAILYLAHARRRTRALTAES